MVTSNSCTRDVSFRLLMRTLLFAGYTEGAIAATSHLLEVVVRKYGYASDSSYHRGFYRHRLRTGQALRSRQIQPGSGGAQRPAPYAGCGGTAPAAWHCGKDHPA